MDETVTPETPPKEGLHHRYNCPEYSDGVIHATTLPSQQADVPQNTPYPPDPSTKIYAHKIVLAAGSQAFDRYFQAQEKVGGINQMRQVVMGEELLTKRQRTRQASDEIPSERIYPSSEKVIISMLRHLYGLPLFSGKERSQDTARGMFEVTLGSAEYWGSLCNTAEAFEIPSLQQLAFERLKDSLEALFIEGASEDPRDRDGGYDKMAVFIESY